MRKTGKKRKNRLFKWPKTLFKLPERAKGGDLQ